MSIHLKQKKRFLFIVNKNITAFYFFVLKKQHFLQGLEQIIVFPIHFNGKK